MARIVTVPLAVAKQEDGSDLYLYQGVELPASLTHDEVSRLVEGGFATEIVAPEADEVTIPEGAPSEEWSNKQLDAYADAKGIDIKTAKNKAEKLAAFAAASA